MNVRARTLAFLIGFAAIMANLTAQEIAKAGALAKDGKWEVSVDFDETVAPNSVVNIENYSLPNTPIPIEAIRYVPHNNAVVLTVSGLRTNDLYSVEIRNLRTTNNLVIPTVTTGFIALPFSWAAIGAQELGFIADTVVIEEEGFDLVSGGATMRDEYDESTFVYEQVTGNFDKKVRIAFQEASSAEARAGLMARETLDAGRARPIIPDEPPDAFSRYIQVNVNPATTATGEAGANTHQVNVRAVYGTTESLNITNNAAPPGSNTWVRLRRVGEIFEAFRSEDGTNWINLATFTFPTNSPSGGALAPIARTLFVGANFAPEVGNIPASSGERRAFLAQFRGYDDTGLLPAEPPTLTIGRIGNQVEIHWEGGGTLQATTNIVSGPWIDLSIPSPARTNITKRFEFFRVRVP